MTNRENLKKIFLPFVLTLVFLNVLYFSFFFNKTYYEFSIQTELEVSNPTQVWYVYKNKYSEDRFFSEKKQLSSNNTHLFNFSIKSDQEIDYIGLFWLAEEGSSINISLYKYTVQEKVHQSTKNRDIIQYTSKGSLLESHDNGVKIQSTKSKRNWIMLNDTTKLNDNRDYKIHSLMPWVLNIFLTLGVFILFCLRRKKEPLFFENLNLNLKNIKLILLLVWAFIIPYWVIVSHSFMGAIVVITFFENYKNKTLDRLLKTFKVNIFFIALYIWIIVSSLFTSSINHAFDNILDYSYFLLMPFVFQGLSKNDLNRILNFFQIGLLSYCFLFLIFATSNYFKFNPDYSFVKFLKLNMELFWHTSYISALILMLFVGKLKAPIRGNYKLMVFYAAGLIFMYSINARIPFIVGILLLGMNLYKSLEKRYVRLRFIVFTIFVSVASVIFFLIKEPLKNSKEKNVIGDINNLDARMSIWSSSLSEIKTNFVFGVSNANTVDAITNSIDDNVTTKFRNYNSHNQFLEIFLAHGIIAFVLLILIFYGLYKTKNIYAKGFMLCSILLFFVESYFQRQAGIIFFTFWYSFFMLYKPTKKESI